MGLCSNQISCFGPESILAWGRDLSTAVRRWPQVTDDELRYVKLPSEASSINACWCLPVFSWNAEKLLITRWEASHSSLYRWLFLGGPLLLRWQPQRETNLGMQPQGSYICVLSPCWQLEEVWEILGSSKLLQPSHCGPSWGKGSVQKDCPSCVRVVGIISQLLELWLDLEGLERGEKHLGHCGWKCAGFCPNGEEQQHRSALSFKHPRLFSCVNCHPPPVSANAVIQK